MGTSADIRKCPSCGADIPVNALLCPKCGRANVSTAFASPSSGPKSSSEDSSSSIFSYTTSESPVAPAQTVENKTLQVRSTEIPRTILPWETAYAPLDTSQTASPGNRPVNGLPEQVQAVPAVESGGNEQAELDRIAQLRKAMVQAPERTMEDMRHAQLVSREQQPVLRQPSGHGTAQQAGQANPSQGWNGAYQSGYGQGQPNGQAFNPYEYSGEPPDGQHWQEGARSTYRVSATAAFMLELLGYVGFLGVGHIFAGRYRRGFAIMVAWWIVIASVCRLLLAVSTQPENLIFLSALLLPVLSGFWIKYDVDRNGSMPSSSKVRRN